MRNCTGDARLRDAMLGRWGLAICVMVALAMGAGSAWGQSTGGRIRGTVTDQSGAAVAAAKVSLTNVATNVSREAQSAENGEYTFIEIPVGTYDMEVTQQGFKKYVRKGVVLDLNEVISVDVILQLGGSAETVEVTGTPPVVDTTSTQLGAVVDSREVTELPLNARDTYQLLQLQPGVQSQIGNDLFFGSDRAGVVTVNGGRGRSNNYSVNGGDGNDLFANLPAIQPSPDSIEEFRVITNTFDAEYGRNSGAVVNVVTKSGTNDYHGSLFEFFRNKDLNARGYYDPVKNDSIQNQFGGTFGGPVRKDKTFFFASYEGRRIKKGISSFPVYVPSAAELGGDFSATGVQAGQTDFTGSIGTQTVADLLNSRPGCAAAASAAGGGAITQGASFASVFPGLKIPTQCFDPVSQSLIANYVRPANVGANSFQHAPDSFDNGDQFTFKLDHDLSKNMKLAAYYYYDNDNSIDPFAKFQAGGGDLGNFPGRTKTKTQQINVTHTWTIGSTAVNEARFTYFREAQPNFNTPTVNSSVQNSCGTGAASAYCFTGVSDAASVNAICAGGAASTLDCGIHPNLGATKEGLPFISLNGGFSIGNNFEGQLPQVGSTYQISDNYSKIIGTHSLKFGADFRNQHFDQLLYYNVNGDFTFTGGGPNDVGAPDQYPNFLLGLPNNYSQGSAQHELVRSKSIYLFAQDSWKIKPNLTLNYGLRWEMNTPLTDVGQKVQTFRPGQVSTVYPCQISPSDPLFAQFGSDCNAAGVTPVGLVFPGDKGIPKGLTDTYKKGFAPRLGLNWSPSAREGWLAKLTGGPNKTSVTMGYGIFYNPVEQLVLEQFSAEPPFGISNSISSPLFQTPFIDQSGNVYPNAANGILNPPRGQAVDWANYRSILLYGQFPKNLRLQYSDQYNLTIKRELPGNTLLQIGYVGTQGHRLLANYQLNPGAPQTCLGIAAISAANPNEVLTANGGSTTSCAQFGEDSSYFITPGTVIPAGGLYLPYGPSGPTTLPAGSVVGPQGVTLVGIRKYSSPLCAPLTGVGCPSDQTAVFSGIYSEAPVAYSNYNSLQVLVEKRYSHGLQLQAAYTLSKSLDNASSFEESLIPGNFRGTYGPSLYDARHRFVLSYVWAIPAPKYEGFKGQLLDGWEASGIFTLQSGFPIRIVSSDDNELLDATSIFQSFGEPDLVGKFKTQNPSKNGGYVFDNSTGALFNESVTLGNIGSSPRTVCCNPIINNWDMGFFKGFQLGEKLRMEARTEIYNLFNHTQFYSVDGNISDGPTFGQAQKVRDPREIQFAIKFLF